MTTAPVPGMNYPTQKAMLAGNPRDSAMQEGVNANVKLANMNGKIGGKKRGGAVASNAEAIPVPQYQMLYTPQGGSTTNPNAQIQQNAGISTQGAANAVYDSQATQKGGKRKSGSRKSRSSRKVRKSRKIRKSRRTRR